MRRLLWAAGVALAAAAVPGIAAQPPVLDAAAALVAQGDSATAGELLDTWLVANPEDPAFFAVLLQAVVVDPSADTVAAALAEFGHRLTPAQTATLQLVPADLAELRGAPDAAVAALQALPAGERAAHQRRHALLAFELGWSDPPLLTGASSHDAPAIELERVLQAAFAAADRDPETAGPVLAPAAAGYALVQVLGQQGRSAEAQAVLTELQRRYPRSPELYLARTVIGELSSGEGLPAAPPGAADGAYHAGGMTLVPYASPLALLGAGWARWLTTTAPAAGRPPATAASPAGPARLAEAATSRAAGEPDPPPASDVSTPTATALSTAPASAMDAGGSSGSAAVADDDAAGSGTLPAAAFAPGLTVQSGAYRDHDNALQMAEQLRGAGFAADVRAPGGGDSGTAVHRVTIGRHLSRIAATAMLRQLRDAGFDGFIRAELGAATPGDSQAAAAP